MKITTAEAIAFVQALNATRERKVTYPAATAQYLILASDVLTPIVKSWDTLRNEKAQEFGATESNPVPAENLDAFFGAIDPVLKNEHEVALRKIGLDGFGKAELTFDEMSAFKVVVE